MTEPTREQLDNLLDHAHKRRLSPTEVDRLREGIADLREQLALSQAGASQRETLLTEARDALEEHGGHGNAWPDIVAPIHALIAERDQLAADVRRARAYADGLTFRTINHGLTAAGCAEQLRKVLNSPPELTATPTRFEWTDDLAALGVDRIVHIGLEHAGREVGALVLDHDRAEEMAVSVLGVTGREEEQQARAERAEAAVQRVRDLADDMRTWHTPRDIGVNYADRIRAALDTDKPLDQLRPQPGFLGSIGLFGAINIPQPMTAEEYAGIEAMTQQLAQRVWDATAGLDNQGQA